MKILSREAINRMVDNSRSAQGSQSSRGGGGGGGQAVSLANLTDVAISTPIDGGSVLTFDETAGKWVAGPDVLTTMWDALTATGTEQIDASHLTGVLGDYATETWVSQNFISIAYFDRLFRAYNGNTLVNHNDETTTIDNIKAMFGFWTEQYLSALGNSGGGSVSLTLANMGDVSLNNLAEGQILVYDATSQKWVNQSASIVGNYLPLTGGTLTGDLFFTGYNNRVFGIKRSYSPVGTNFDVGWDWSNRDGSGAYFRSVDAGNEAGQFGFYARDTTNTTQLIGTPAGSLTWGGYEVLTENNIKTINGQSIYGSGDISVGGGASGNYLPLTGGTLMGNLQIYATSGLWVEGIRIHLAPNGWSGVVLCGPDNTGSSGTSAKTWGIHNYNGDFYLAKNGSTNFTHGASWNNSGALNLKTSSFTVNGGANVASFTSDSSNAYIFAKTNGNSAKAAFGYYEGLASISVETNYYRIGLTDNGTPVFRKGANTSAAQYKLLHGGESIELWATGSSYEEGIRIHPTSNGWCGLILCGSDNTGSSGTSAKTWGVFNKNGKFFINKNGAETQTSDVLCNPNGNWGVGTLSPNYKLHVNGTLGAGNTSVANLESEGYVSALSDIRKKDVVEYMEGLTIEQIAEAPIIKFLWKDRPEEGLQVGSVAQEWQKILPQSVHRSKDDHLSFSYGVAALVSSISTARKVVDHEMRIAELERENKELKMKLNIA